MHVDSGGGGGQPSADYTAIGENMAMFAAMAADGGIEVNETGGEALLTAIRNLKDWADRQQRRLVVLGQELPLGSSHAAMVMKPYVQQVAIDGQGFLTQLGEFIKSLENAEQGIQTAMANYRATEEANQAALRKTGPE